MAVAARSSGPSEARIPCPQCGGLIHPIAGRCKHCKADVAALRSARPAAATALPALARGLANGAPGNHGQVAAAVATVANTPVAIHRQEASQPVLPPRPTEQMPSAEPRSLWRNWPLIVIALALLAIGTAVVMMLWPPSNRSKVESRTLAPPPAPERMDTNPLPPPSAQPPAPQPPGADPWTSPGGGAGPSGQIDPPDDPDDTIDPDDILKDPFAGPRGLPKLPRLGTNAFAFTLFGHACKRFASCGNAQPILTDYCAMIDRMIPSSPPPSCTAAKSCLDQADQLDCSTAFNSITDLMKLVQSPDCEAATRC
jgi:hypothetical protein